MIPVVFANPAGFWALLGIPAILLIHLLQRESKRLPVSTLFLLENIDRESIQGRKIERLRNSIPLWLQLLGVLFLTWILTEPRWASDRSAIRVVMVFDSSASMSAFQDRMAEEIKAKIPPLTEALGTTEYTCIESHESGNQLYRGTSFPDLLDSLLDWAPGQSAHSPETALRTGRSLAGSEGILIFVTDHVPDQLPFAAALLSVGEPIENVGFTGFKIDADGDSPTWEVSIRNYSDTDQARQWVLTSGETRTEPRKISLSAGEIRSLKGKFPESRERISLVMEDDRFSRDDRLFLVVPQPKRLLLAQAGSANTDSLVRSIIDSVENAPMAKGEERPDVAFATYDPLNPEPFPPVSIVFLNQQSVPQQFLKGPIVAANHPLVAGLDWQGLIAKVTPSIPAKKEDVSLLWQGERPLIFLREAGGQSQLLFNFDVMNSNANRMPAFVVLIHRFLSRIRDDKVALEVRNTELSEPISLAVIRGESAPDLKLSTDSGNLTIPLIRATSLQSPRNPGFFEMAQGDQPLLRGSANFADTREADFSDAVSNSTLGTLPKQIIEQQTISDPWWQIWAVLLISLAILSWYFLSKTKRRSGNGRNAVLSQ